MTSSFLSDLHWSQTSLRFLLFSLSYLLCFVLRQPSLNTRSAVHWLSLWEWHPWQSNVHLRDRKIPKFKVSRKFANSCPTYFALTKEPEIERDSNPRPWACLKRHEIKALDRSTTMATFDIYLFDIELWSRQILNRCNQKPVDGWVDGWMVGWVV